MSNKSPRCDACNKRIRPTPHELRLSDFVTGQLVGIYHARPGCQLAATKYFERGVVLKFDIVHPARCGGDFEECDTVLSEEVA